MEHADYYLREALDRHALGRPYIRLESDDAMVVVAKKPSDRCFWSLAFEPDGLSSAGVAEEELGAAGLNSVAVWALWGQVDPSTRTRLIAGGKGGRPTMRQRGRMWVALLNAAETRYVTVESHAPDGSRQSRSERIPLRGLRRSGRAPGSS